MRPRLLEPDLAGVVSLLERARIAKQLRQSSTGVYGKLSPFLGEALREGLLPGLEPCLDLITRGELREGEHTAEVLRGAQDLATLDQTLHADRAERRVREQVGEGHRGGRCVVDPFGGPQRAVRSQPLESEARQSEELALHREAGPLLGLFLALLREVQELDEVVLGAWWEQANRRQLVVRHVLRRDTGVVGMLRPTKVSKCLRHCRARGDIAGGMYNEVGVLRLDASVLELDTEGVRGREAPHDDQVLVQPGG
jgi:hypothetical protein